MSAYGDKQLNMIIEATRMLGARSQRSIQSCWLGKIC